MAYHTRQAISWKNVNNNQWRRVVSLGHTELIFVAI